MLSFLQFLNESKITHHGTSSKHLDSIYKTGRQIKENFIINESQSGIKGWMSPSGEVHLFSKDEEHHENLPDKAKKKIGSKLGGFDRLKAAQQMGYTRFGSTGSYHYIHYDHSNPSGRKSAEHTLKFLKPKMGDDIFITKSAGLSPVSKDHYTKSPSEARKSINEGVESLFYSKTIALIEAIKLQEAAGLLKKEEQSNDFSDSFVFSKPNVDIKCPMCYGPSVTPKRGRTGCRFCTECGHQFQLNEEKLDFENTLSETDLSHVADAYVNKYGAKKDVTGHGLSLQKVLSHPEYVKGQCHTVSHDFARWGKANYPEHKYKVISRETHDSTTERPSPHFAVQVNGKEVIDLTSRQFHPENPVIHITSKKEFHKNYPKNLNKEIILEADPRPVIQTDHKGLPIIPSLAQYYDYFEFMAASHIKAALTSATNRWETAQEEMQKRNQDAQNNRNDASKIVAARHAAAEVRALGMEISAARQALKKKESAGNAAMKKQAKKREEHRKTFHSAVTKTARALSGGSPLVGFLAHHAANALFGKKE